MRAEQLNDIAISIGFDAIGVTPIALLSADLAHLQTWIAQGKHASMSYLERNHDKREDLSQMVEGAKSVIVTLVSYHNPKITCQEDVKIASYAYGEDYHQVLKDKLLHLQKELSIFNNREIRGRCFTDSAPIFEHEYARRAGLGWIGNNTLLLNKKLGSYTFIGVLVSDLEFEVYSTPFDHSFCGQCTKCVDACPTGALSIHQVDARKCISFHTIESKEEIPREIRASKQGWIYGCDICQQVCPWNNKAIYSTEPRFSPLIDFNGIDKTWWLEQDKVSFKNLFKKSAMQRAGIEKIKSNID